ncbi:unnamed protein product [Brassica rapa]|uniref:DNA mismatch repair proteins mutS family domain-containing protein n=2 Tax=Brassica campestris TaxID=3711 RepID=A0A8D9LUS0_BRACM|nr:unnamed protein product [Brassica rapa]
MRNISKIINGANMGGENCYICLVALISIMALSLVGSFKPASFAKGHVLDGVFTRTGATSHSFHIIFYISPNVHNVNAFISRFSSLGGYHISSP